MKRRLFYILVIIFLCSAIVDVYFTRWAYLYLTGEIPQKLTEQTYNEKTLAVTPSSFPIYSSVTDIGYYRVPLTKSDFESAFHSGYTFNEFHRSDHAPSWWQPPKDSPFQFRRQDQYHIFEFIYDEPHETLYATHHWTQHSAFGSE